MTALLIVLAIIGVVLTLWLILIPAGMLVSGFSAFRHGDHGWKGRGKHG